MNELRALAPRRFGRLLVSDAMSVGRDPVLIAATVMSVIPAIALFLTRDAIDAAALDAFGIAAFSRYIVPVALLLPTFLVGWVTGFLLLEDRDERTLTALDVTPVGKGGFLLYRATVTALITAAITLMGLVLIAPDAGLGLQLLILVLVPAEAVIAAIILPAIARNKVEGLALTKLINIGAVIPLLAILPSPFRLVAGIVPTYWIGELFALSDAPPLPFPLVAAAAILTHALWGIVLFRFFLRRTG